jgi:hypothetical protein
LPRATLAKQHFADSQKRLMVKYFFAESLDFCREFSLERRQNGFLP